MAAFRWTGISAQRLQLASLPEFLYNTFGGSNQFNMGFSASLVYRFGKK